MLAAYVQHHPSREELLPGLLSRLGPSPAVVPDPDPDAELRSPWRTYRACLERAAHEGHPSALVIQDDAVPCPLGFWEAACRAASARPGSVLVLFVPGALRAPAALVRAYAGRRPYAPIRTFTWLSVVALIWPTPLIDPALAWVDRQRWPARFRADDEIVGRALSAIRAPVLATCPSLVEHPDVTPSLIGMRHRAGRDHGRVAACYADDCDVRTIDWEAAP